MPENENKTPIDPEALAAFNEQAEDFDSFLRPLEIKLRDGGSYKVTHPNMLDDDGAELYEELLYEVNQCDRGTEEVPESSITLKDGAVTTIPAHTVKGGFITPYQKDGKRLTPGYNIRLAKILLGTEEEYQKFKAAGGTANAISHEYGRRAAELAKRRMADSKSANSAVVSEAVAEAD